MNIAMVMGRLGGDPEIKMGDGFSICRISVATSRRFTDKSGNMQEKTEWHKVVFWNRTAEIVAKHFKKGDPIFIQGRTETRQWEDDSGRKNYITELVADRFEFVPKPTNYPESDSTPNFNSQEEIPF